MENQLDSFKCGGTVKGHFTPPQFKVRWHQRMKSTKGSVQNAGNMVQLCTAGFILISDYISYDYDSDYILMINNIINVLVYHYIIEKLNY